MKNNYLTNILVDLISGADSTTECNFLFCKFRCI